MLERSRRHDRGAQPELNAIVGARPRPGARRGVGAAARAALRRAVHGQGGDRRRRPARPARPRACGPSTTPAEDAPAVALLREAGAILIGKTNISELCAYPRLLEPRLRGDPESPSTRRGRPAGSSGGEAAAVAAGPLGVRAGIGLRRLDSRPGPLLRRRRDAPRYRPRARRPGTCRPSSRLRGATGRRSGRSPARSPTSSSSSRCSSASRSAARRCRAGSRSTATRSTAPSTGPASRRSRRRPAASTARSIEVDAAVPARRPSSSYDRVSAAESRETIACARPARRRLSAAARDLGARSTPRRPRPSTGGAGRARGGGLRVARRPPAAPRPGRRVPGLLGSGAATPPSSTASSLQARERPRAPGGRRPGAPLPGGPSGRRADRRPPGTRGRGARRRPRDRAGRLTGRVGLRAGAPHARIRP